LIPFSFINGIVNDPVIPAFAVWLPLTEPMTALAMTAVCAIPESTYFADRTASRRIRLNRDEPREEAVEAVDRDHEDPEDAVGREPAVAQRARHLWPGKPVPDPDEHNREEGEAERAPREVDHRERKQERERDLPLRRPPDRVDRDGLVVHEQVPARHDGDETGREQQSCLEPALLDERPVEFGEDVQRENEPEEGDGVPPTGHLLGVRVPHHYHPERDRVRHERHPKPFFDPGAEPEDSCRYAENADRPGNTQYGRRQRLGGCCGCCRVLNEERRYPRSVRTRQCGR
jgi:hypothetical protein